MVQPSIPSTSTRPLLRKISFTWIFHTTQFVICKGGGGGIVCQQEDSRDHKIGYQPPQYFAILNKFNGCRNPLSESSFDLHIRKIYVAFRVNLSTSFDVTTLWLSQACLSTPTTSSGRSRSPTDVLSDCLQDKAIPPPAHHLRCARSVV